jgi:hypothetical protein
MSAPPAPPLPAAGSGPQPLDVRGVVVSAQGEALRSPGVPEPAMGCGLQSKNLACAKEI